MNIPAITTQQMAEVDRLMIEEYGIQLIQMMENAGRNLAELARQMLGGNPAGRKIAVLCGTGNNGGGGMVAARHLHNWGASVLVALTGAKDKLKEVPAAQWRILKTMAVPEIDQMSKPDEPTDLIIDAMIGYGLQGNPHGRVAEWIRWTNSQQCPILALDTPSGLDTTTGDPGNPAIRATSTLTLALPKMGLRSPQAEPYVGELYLADIGVPPELYGRIDVQIGPIFNKAMIVKIG
jgi:NAD(P)H-hydrate epimerase